MTVRNDKVVHPLEDLDVEEDHSLNHCALSHVHYLISRNGSKAKEFNSTNWRKHSFKVILPKRLSKHDDSDLRLMRVSLKNTIAAASVHLLRIERELKQRGSEVTILR